MTLNDISLRHYDLHQVALIYELLKGDRQTLPGEVFNFITLARQTAVQLLSIGNGCISLPEV